MNDVKAITEIKGWFCFPGIPSNNLTVWSLFLEKKGKFKCLLWYKKYVCLCFQVRRLISVKNVESVLVGGIISLFITRVCIWERRCGKSEWKRNFPLHCCWQCHGGRKIYVSFILFNLEQVNHLSLFGFYIPLKSFKCPHTHTDTYLGALFLSASKTRHWLTQMLLIPQMS